jgi:hypothetical protein
LHRPSFIGHDFTHTFPRTIIIDIIRVLGSDLCHQFVIPAVSQVANRDAFKKFWPPNTVVPIFEELLDGRGIVLTGNDNTVYSWTWIDLKDGPVVLEAPPKVHDTANDMWQRWVVDVGVTGPDKGRGGKYLFVPPCYKGALFRSAAVTSFTRPPSASGSLNVVSSFMAIQNRA